MFAVHLISVCMIFSFVCQPFLVSSAAIRTNVKPSWQVLKNEATKSTDFIGPTNHLRKIRAVERSKDKRYTALYNKSRDGGDMLWPSNTALNGIPGVQHRWPGYPGYPDIPYVIDDALYGSKNLIERAMYEYHRNTCIRFVKRTTERDYIKIISGDGCVAMVGRGDASDQPQMVSIGDGCVDKGTILHELAHAIGLYHEQNRSDRDDFLTIQMDNVEADNGPNFRLLQEDENLIFSTFDFNSIMLYGSYAFSKDPDNLRTMIATNGQDLLDPYEKTHLTRYDIKKIRRMYKCNGRSRRRR